MRDGVTRDDRDTVARQVAQAIHDWMAVQLDKPEEARQAPFTPEVALALRLIPVVEARVRRDIARQAAEMIENQPVPEQADNEWWAGVMETRKWALHVLALVGQRGEADHA